MCASACVFCISHLHSTFFAQSVSARQSLALPFNVAKTETCDLRTGKTVLKTTRRFRTSQLRRRRRRDSFWRRRAGDGVSKLSLERRVLKTSTQSRVGAASCQCCAVLQVLRRLTSRLPRRRLASIRLHRQHKLYILRVCSPNAARGIVKTGKAPVKRETKKKKKKSEVGTKNAEARVRSRSCQPVFSL